jgi:hypothetical protein
MYCASYSYSWISLVQSINYNMRIVLCPLPSAVLVYVSIYMETFLAAWHDIVHPQSFLLKPFTKYNSVFYIITMQFVYRTCLVSMKFVKFVKFPVTLLGIEPTTLQLVAQHINQLHHRVPPAESMWAWKSFFFNSMEQVICLLSYTAYFITSVTPMYINFSSENIPESGVHWFVPRHTAYCMQYWCCGHKAIRLVLQGFITRVFKV